MQKAILDENLASLNCKLADGLSYLPEDVDCCCILGMGGNTIYEILKAKEAHLHQFQAIIIEPQSNAQLPISYLLDHGFENDEGLYVYEKRYYPLLRFIPSKQKTTNELERKYGPSPVRKKDPYLFSLLKKELSQLHPYKKEKTTKVKYDILVNECKEIFSYDFEKMA